MSMLHVQDSPYIKTIHYDSADGFIEAISYQGELYNLFDKRFIFRGHSTDKYELLPSVLRGYLAIEKGLIPVVSPEDWLSETRSNAQTDGSIIVKEPQSYVDVFIMNKDCINDKGAMMIHTLRQMIGDEAFFKGLKNYATDPKLLYHTSKSEDFIRHFEEVSGKDLKSFFNEWLYNEGIPSDLK